MIASSMRAWRRNWPAVIGGLLVTAGLVAVAASLTPASFVATSQVVLLPPVSQRNGTEVTTVNPYLSLAGLQGMADIMARSMMDDETAATLRTAGVGKYTVLYDNMSAGPLLVLTVEGSSPAKATSSLQVLTEQVPTTILRLQAATETDTRFYVTTRVVAGPGLPQRSGKSQARAMGIALVLGLALTQFTVVVMDAWRRRSSTEPQPQPVAEPGPESGKATGPESGKATGPESGKATGPESGKATDPESGNATEPAAPEESPTDR